MLNISQNGTNDMKVDYSPEQGNIIKFYLLPSSLIKMTVTNEKMIEEVF